MCGQKRQWWPLRGLHIYTYMHTHQPVQFDLLSQSCGNITSHYKLSLYGSRASVNADIKHLELRKSVISVTGFSVSETADLRSLLVQNDVKKKQKTFSPVGKKCLVHTVIDVRGKWSDWFEVPARYK